MKVQSINQFKTYGNFNSRNRVDKVNSTSFKGNYSQVMRDVLARDLKTRGDVEVAISHLYSALVKEDGITKTSIQPKLAAWFAVKGTYLIEELCKPVAQIPSELREVYFASQDENLPVIKKSGEDLLYIMNLGKHGFWNSIFENESAKNDVKIVFMSNDGCFEVGTNKDGRLVSEQSYHSGYWVKNKYYMIFGDRFEHKTGNASDTIIWPPV